MRRRKNAMLKLQCAADEKWNLIYASLAAAAATTTATSIYNSLYFNL